MEISICDGALKSRLARGKAFYCDMAIPLGDQRVEFAHHLEGGPYVCSVWLGREVECAFFFSQGGRAWVHDRTSR